MGRKRGSRGRGDKRGEKRPNVWDQDKEGEGSDPKRAKKDDDWNISFVYENEDFSNYYKVQKVVPTDEEWDNGVLEYMKKPLPTTFRINGTQSDAYGFRDMLVEKYVKGMAEYEVDGEKWEPPQPLAFYPNNLGWKFNIPRHVLRKNEGLKKFHLFLQAETAQGNISRQEAVSMIPPLFLDVKPHQFVLDMCAAPGSKTAQLLEDLHSNGVRETSRGIVIANDVDFKRCEMLVHQTKRIGSPAMLVVNHNAQHIPNFKYQDPVDGQVKNMEFDRVLADVPCSGDGTMRKAPDMWRKWGPGQAQGLHKLQVMIAARGINLLKVGGRMVYSTCSMNPIENEAVVAEVLRQFKGTVRLVDVSAHLPGLVRSPGMSKWKVLYRGKEWATTMDDIQDPYKEKKTSPSFFQPTDEEAAQFHLERCVRVFPHQQDTGGFFITVLEKTDTLRNQRQTQEKAEKVSGAPDPNEEVKEEKSAEKNVEAAKEGDASAPAESTSDKPKKAYKIQREQKKAWREAPFLTLDDDIWKQLKDFYGMDGLTQDAFMKRGDKGNKIYTVAPLLRNILLNNEWSRLKVVSAAVKAFDASTVTKQQGKMCPFRWAQESRVLLSNHAPKRTVTLPFEMFCNLIELRRVKMGSAQAPEIQEKVASFDCGSLIVKLDMSTVNFDDLPHLKKAEVTLMAWRGEMSVQLFIPKMEYGSVLRQLGRELKEEEANAPEGGEEGPPEEEPEPQNDE